MILSTHDAEKGLSVADHIFNLDHGKLTESPILNVFKGISEFRNGEWILMMDHHRQLVHSTEVLGSCAFQVDPAAVTLAGDKHISTARNQFQVKITGLIQKQHHVLAHLDAGFKMTAHLTGKIVQCLEFEDRRYCLGFI